MSVETVGRTRNSNAEPLGRGSGDLLVTAGVIGASALGGYFLTDYIIKSNVFDQILGSLGLSTPAPKDENVPAAAEVNTGGDDAATKSEDSKQAYIMTPLGPELIGEMIDRDSRQNSAYLAAKRRQFNEPNVILEEEIDIANTNEGDYNQIVTDNDVYFHY
jgi:hypothetical protein